MVTERYARLTLLLEIGQKLKNEGKTWQEIKDILVNHCIKAWRLSGNARLDYIKTIKAELEFA